MSAREFMKLPLKERRRIMKERVDANANALVKHYEEEGYRRSLMSKTPEETRPKVFTINDIRSWNPCYDPALHLPEDWSGTVLDMLAIDSIPQEDRLWVVCREELISARVLRLFAVWCARQVEHLLTDDRSKAAIEVAERYANGLATDEELAAAGDAAWAAAGDADGVAAWAADRDAARAAACAAGRAVAWDAARAAQIAQLAKMVREDNK